ncbi:MAG: S8 family serine peptidase [Phycisphaerales bacterium JB052]
MSQHARIAMHPSRSSNRRPLAMYLMAAAGLVAGFAAPASAQSATANGAQSGAKGTGATHSSNNVLEGKPMKVKLGNTDAEFVIAAPQAKMSDAVRVVNPAVPQFNLVKQVYAQISVGARNEQVLQRALSSATAALTSDQQSGFSYRKFSGMDDVFIIDTPTVEDAIVLVERMKGQPGVEWTEVAYREPLEALSMGGPTITTDPNAPFQWHVFNNPALFAAPFDGNHMIDQAYARGYSGQGVTVGVLEADQNSFYRVDDQGVLEIHPDLALKTDFDLSIPTDPYNTSYSHGVSVAGLIGAEGNNGLQGAGVAYNSTLVSLRNGNSIDQGESLSHELNKIDIINNSWGPASGSFPPNSVGKVLVEFPDDYEIVVPQITHSGLARIVDIGLDQGIRLGRNRDGRIFVFAAGNDSHFQGFDRLAVGNAISLPGIGVDPDIDPYGYLDIEGLDPADNDGDGIPDVFILDGVPDDGLGWRWSGHFGDRTEYSSLTSLSRTIAIASVGQSNAVSGYSTTGTSVFIGAYSQDSILAQEFDPNNQAWFPSAVGLGVLTIEQADGEDQDAIDCNAVITGLNFLDDDIETCMFNGTSAAAPIASGIIALMLEANPSLTLRDIQTILQQTAIVPETTGADPVGSDFYDTTKSYWPAVYLGLGQLDPDDSGPPSPTFWTTNSAGVRHSDEYGFGIIDADAAIQAAETWGGVRPLVMLDSGTVEGGDDEGGNPNFDDGTIEDATFEPAVVLSENLETNVLVPGTRLVLPIACVRENIQVEGVELDLTIEGDGAGDLMIALQGPRGTVSPLAIPRGDSNALDGTAYDGHTFTTYKHWGELAGGTWTLYLQDFRPDEESPEGTPPDEEPDPDSPESYGVEQVTYLGVFGLPGNDEHSGKTLVSYRLRVYGHEIGAPVFEGCPPQLTGCPGDLDGNGRIDVLDLQIYLNWYMEGNILADLNGDGTINYTDLIVYRSLWIPGNCGASGVLGRPRPGTTNGDNDPVVRPI